MDELERVTIESLQRIHNFGLENITAVGVNSKAKTAFEAIGSFVALLDETGAIRTSADAEKLTQTGFRRVKRSEMNSFLVWMSRTARDIARNDETFVNKFRIPRLNLNDAMLLETARAFYADSAAVGATFIEYGFPADFRDDLDGLIDEFDAAINAQDAALRERVSSNATVDELLDNALTARRTLLIIVPNIFHDKPGKLSDWASASHIEKLPKAEKTTPTE